MSRPTETIPERVADPRRGETWREVWARHVRADQPRATSRMPRGHSTKQPQPEGKTPLERDERPIDQNR